MGGLSEVRQRMAAAAERSGRALDGITLVAVTKTATRAQIAAAFEAGQHDFGENRADRIAEGAALLPGAKGAAQGLLLRAARHPLLIEQVRRESLSEVVPIDLRLGSEFDMLIITGPNTGGKTLALKTAGLFALLTRMGLPVPAAEGTTIPLYDRIEADIGDEGERLNRPHFVVAATHPRIGAAAFGEARVFGEGQSPEDGERYEARPGYAVGDDGAHGNTATRCGLLDDGVRSWLRRLRGCCCCCIPLGRSVP